MVCSTPTPTPTDTALPTPTPTFTPTPVATPFLTDVTRDKTTSPISDWIDITFDSVAGVWYDVYTSPSMTSPTWSLQGSIQASGASTSYRDPGPVSTETYYRIEVQGTGVYAPNEAGSLPVTVVGKEAAEGTQLALVGVSLVPTNAGTIQEEIGWQMTGTLSVDSADEIWWWGGVGYERNWLFDSGGAYPTYDGM